MQHLTKELVITLASIFFYVWYSNGAPQESEALVKEALGPGFEACCAEVSVYLCESVGNATRVDYGTGHELAFIMFLACLFKVSVCLFEGESILCSR